MRAARVRVLDARCPAQEGHDVRCLLVSHFHWDREWYRTFESYRARLVDAVDCVLDLLAADCDFRFLLDGQSILLEDYLAVRPSRRDELTCGIREGRLAVGPWYVQPDSLLPSGEAHVRNLLHGRALAMSFDAVSRVGYVPDSFGHPAQLPQLLAGFGITSFVHWRGNGNEVDRIGTVYRWVAPDGSTVTARLLRDGYFDAACLPADVDEAASRLAEVLSRRGDGDDEPVLLLNGFDHMLPDGHIAAVTEALARRAGRRVERGLLEDALTPDRDDLPEVRGELVGARLANLLPGVWSTRMPIKLANRRCETLLEGWAEPWAALARRLGAPDERPALRRAWPRLLECQAHDSLCACSLDAVARDVAARLAEAEGLTHESVSRLLGRLAGLGVERRTPWTVEQELAVFNPSPHPRTDVVRVPLDPYPALRLPVGLLEFPPLAVAAAEGMGFEIDGRPARVVRSNDPGRPRWMPDQEALDLEVVVADVPAFGCRRLHLTTAPPSDHQIDEGNEIASAGVHVHVARDGTFDVRLGGAEYGGLLAVEDRGDRGDSYDFDPVDDDRGIELISAGWRRWHHPGGLAGIEVARTFMLPRGLDASRTRRRTESDLLTLWTEARIAPGVPRVDLTVRVDNPADDHRLRLLFPTGRPVASFHAATTFDVAARTTSRSDDARWVHRAPATFPHQGWVSANGLTVVAPGLPEAEVTDEGTIAITLLRAVGWLARFDLRSRPVPAGPVMPIPGAQLRGPLEARLALLAGVDPIAARDAELGFWALLGGPAPLLPAGEALLALEPSGLVLSSLKPAENGDGIVVRLLNPTGVPLTAILRPGFPVRAVRAVRLDEEPASDSVTFDRGVVRFEVSPHALRSVLLD